MRSSLVVLFILVLGFAWAPVASAQKEAKPFAGEIVYSISFEGGNLSESEKLMLPKEYLLSLSGSKQHGTTKMQMMTQVEFSDSKTGETTMLLDIQGNKMAIKSTREEVEKALEAVPANQIKMVEETKEIAGIKCQKAEVTFGEDIFTVWFAKDLVVDNPNWKSPFKEIKNLLLEYSLPWPGTEMTMKYVATSVKKKKIKDELFTIPSDYKVMTAEEAAAMFGQ